MNINWKTQRFHYNAFGQAKVRYKSEEDAILHAKIVNAKKRFGEDELVAPYICKLCNGWHLGRIGRSSRAVKDTSLWYEIGDRAYYNLVSENSRPIKFRLMRIRNRFRFLGPEYGIDRLR